MRKYGFNPRNNLPLHTVYRQRNGTRSICVHEPDHAMRRIGGLSGAALVLAGACLLSASPRVQAASDSMPVTLSFAGEFAGQAFSCDGQFADTGSTAANVTVSEYKLFVSRVRLLDADGNETPVSLDEDGLWQQQNVALLDFENGEGNCVNGTAPVNTTVTGTVAAGNYTGVAFDVGVPFEANHVDPTLAASPLNLTSMFWNWRGGYRFIRIDMAVSAAMGEAGAMQQSSHGKMQSHGEMKGHDEMKMTSATKEGGHNMHGSGRGWALHIGSTGCHSSSPTTAPQSCAAPNRIEVRLDNFDAGSDTLVIDPATIVQHVDVTRNTPDTSPGCMSAPDDPECAPVFAQLGLGDAGSAQQLIRVR